MLTTISTVTAPASGKYLPEFTINAAEIVELIEAVKEDAAPPVPIPAAAPVYTVPKPKAFEDPAILSVGKRPAPPTAPPNVPSEWHATSMERSDTVRKIVSRGEESEPFHDITPAANLVDPMQNVNLGSIGAGLGVEAQILQELATEEELPEQLVVKSGKRSRRRKGQGRREEAKEPDVTPVRDTTRSKGWRQTPLLEPNPSFQPFSTLKRKKNRANGKADENGWATEEATDVQDMGDFDFAGSLAKFDKHTVFNQIQAEDSVADEDRLVSHNRLPKAKPGTAGGKNLHYTENVLDSPSAAGKTKTDPWKSEAGDSGLDDRASQRGSGSGRLSRRTERAESKLSLTRRPVSRKTSSVIGIPTTRTLSVSHTLPHIALYTPC